MQCIKLLSVNTKVSLFLWLKKCESCKAAGAEPQTPLCELCIPPCWDDRGPGISLSALAAAYQPSLQNPRSAPLFVEGGGGGGAPLLHYVPGRSTTTLRHCTNGVPPPPPPPPPPPAQDHPSMDSGRERTMKSAMNYISAPPKCARYAPQK